MTRLGGGVGVDGVPRKSSPEMTKTEESSTVRPVDAEKPHRSSTATESLRVKLPIVSSQVKDEVMNC